MAKSKDSRSDDKFESSKAGSDSTKDSRSVTDRSASTTDTIKDGKDKGLRHGGHGKDNRDDRDDDDRGKGGGHKSGRHDNDDDHDGREGTNLSFTLEDVTLPTQNAGSTFLTTVTSDTVTPAITLVKSVDADGDVEFNDSEAVAANTVGQTVDYRYVITNTSPAGALDPLTINSFFDTTLGIDLLNDSVVTLVITGGDADSLLEIGETWTYTVNNVVVPAQNAGTTFINSATVTATDNESTPANDTDQATVTYGNGTDDVDPAITIEKTVAPSSVAEGGVDGQTVTYTYVLTNTSTASTDPLAILSLLDDRAGDILADGDFVGGDTNDNGLLDQDETWTYTIDQAVAVGNVGETYSNTATVTGTDDEDTAASDTDTATVTYSNVDPTISVVKEVEPGAVQEGGVDGQTVTYTYVLTNTSTASTDPLAILSLLDDRAGDILADGDFVGGDTNDNGLLDQDETWTYTIDQAVAVGNVGETYSNTATVTGTDDEDTVASATDQATVTYTNVDPAITVEKTVEPSSVAEGGVDGQTVTYTYVLTNTSDASTDPLTILALADDRAGDILADGDFVGGDTNDNGLLDQDETWTYTIDQTVTVGNVGETFSNTVTVLAADDEGTDTGDTDQATVTYTDVTPTLTFVKEVDADGDEEFQDSEAVNEGGVGNQLVDYRYTITNTSLASTDPVTIDSFFDITLGIDLLALSGPIVLTQGASFSFILADQLVPTQNAGTTFLNTATVTGTDDEDTVASATDQATVTYTNVDPAITVLKSVDADGEGFSDSESVAEGTAGQTVDYQYVLTNTSTASTDPLTITSLVDDRGTVAPGDDVNVLTAGTRVQTGGDNDELLESGETWTYTVTDVPVPVGNVGETHVNTALVEAFDDEDTAASDTDTATVTFNNVDPAITIEKTVAPSSVAEGGVDGQTVTYTYGLTNTSDASTDPLAILSLLDTRAGDILADGTFVGGDDNDNGLLDQDETWTYTIDQTVAVGNVDDAYTNTVTVLAADDEETEATDEDSAIVTYTNVDPAITVAKTVDADGEGNVLTGAGFNESEAVGANGVGDQIVTYRYALTNTSDAGTDPLTITSLSDDNGTPSTLLDDVDLLTAAGVTLDRIGGDADTLLESGETWIYTYSKTVPVGAPGDTHINTATVNATDDENTAASDTDTATVTYGDGDPAITIEKTVAPSSVAEGGVDGQTVTYTYVLTNTSDASTDPLIILSLSDDNGTPSDLGDDVDLLTAAGVTLVKSGGDTDPLLESGESWTYTIDQTVAVGNVDDAYTNTVTVLAADDEGTDTGDTDQATVTYTDVTPTLTFVKEVDADGDEEFQDSEAVNEGGVGNQLVDYRYTITNTSLASTDPVTIDSFFDITLGIDLLALSGPIVLTQGASFSFILADQLVPTQNAGTTFLNTATVTGTDDEDTVASATDQATVTYTNVDPAITVEKTVEPSSVAEGGVDGQTVTYTYVLTNTSDASTDPLTILALADDRAGDILADGDFVGGDTNDNGLLDQDETWTYTIDQTVTVGNVGETFSNTVTVLAADDEGTDTGDTDQATVTYTDVTPTLTFVKEVDADGDEEFQDSEAVNEGGVGNQLVDYRYTITNTSLASTDPVTIDSFFDITLGIDLLALSGPIVLTQGASFSFILADQLVPTQNAGTTFLNTATVTGTDDEDTVASATDQATVTYTNVDPAITVEKTVEPSSVAEGGVDGQTVTYTYVLTNTSDASTDPLTILALADDRAGDILADGTFVGGDDNDDGLLNQGESWTYTIDQTVTVGNVGETFSNTVTVLAADDEETEATDEANATVTYTNVDPAITLEKTVEPSAVQEGGVDGQTVTYTYVLTNTSDASTDPLTILALADDRAGDILDVGNFVGGDSNDDGLLNQGESWTYTIDQTVAVGNVGETYSNTVTVLAVDDENIEASAEANATVTYMNVDPAITIEKTVDADGDGNALTGAGFNETEVVGSNGVGDQIVTYRYALTNTSDASTDPLTITSLTDDNGTPVNLLDDVSLLTAAGVTLHKRGGDADELLEGGETWIYTYTKTVPEGDAGDEHINTVTITASDDEDTAASDTDTATVTYDDGSVPEVQTRVLHLEKDATVADGIVDEVGDIINYTLTVTHDLVAGSNAAIAGVVVSDPFTINEAPVLVSGFNTGDTDTDNLLDVGESWNYTASHAVTQDELDAGTPIVNTATVMGTNTTADTASTAVPVVQAPALNITKTLTNEDDAVVDTAGETIEYTITVDNTSNVNLTTVVLTDTFAGDAVLLSGDTNTNNILETTETWTYTADYVVTQADLNAGADLVNVASVDTAQTAPQQADATSTVEQTPALTIVKTLTNEDDAVVDTAGETIEYTITVDNTGNVNLTTVVLTDIFAGDAVLLSGDTNTNNILETTETWTYTADYVVTQADLNAGADLVNVASVDTAQTAPQQADATSTVEQTPALTIIKTLTNEDDAVVDTAGETIEYTITVDNTGNVDLTTVVLTDTFAGDAVLLSGDTNTNNILETTETWTYTADYVVTQADLNAGADLVNVASVDTAQTAPQQAAIAAVPTIGNDVQNQVSIAATDVEAGETATNNGQFTVSLTQTSSSPTVVSYALTGSTATAGTDYVALTGSVTIPDGDTSATIDVSGIVDDEIVEADETVIVTLTGITSGDPQITLDPDAADRTATVSIADNDSATVSITKITDGAEPSTNGLFRVTQSAVSSTNTVINYSVDGASTATAGSDYTTLSGTVTILAGQTTVDISVPVLNDAIVEGTETVVVNLTTFGAHDPDITFDPTPANLTATVDITDNDTNTMAMGPVTVNEAAGTLTFTVTQTGTTAVPIVLNYATTDGTAQDGVGESGAGIPDYTASTGTVTFASGTDGTQTFTVPITNDLVVEGSEAFTVTLTPQIPSQVSGTSTLVATGTITDNDTATWSISGDPVAIEGGAASYTVSLAGTLQAGATATINVGLTDLDTTSEDYASFAAAVTATIGSRTDLSFVAGTMTYLGDGNPMADLVISLDAVDDEAAEVAEDYQVVLSNPGSSTGANIALGTSAATTAILDDNERRLTISNVAQAEGTSLDGFTPYVFTVSLADATTTSSVTVDVTTIDGSATAAGEDYQALPLTTLTFAPGVTEQTVTVQVRQDDQVESDEYFQVLLSNATNATIINNPLFGSGAGLGTITNDDVHTLRISEGVTAAEGTSAAGFTPYVFTVSLAGTPTTSTVQVLASTFDFSGTTAGVDYTAFTNQLVTFAPGETSKTVTVQVRQDDLPEADEFFGVQLSNATNATIINNPLFGSGAGLGTITNDDVHTLRISEGVTAAEGTSAAGFTPYVFTVSLAGTPTTSTVQVLASTFDFSGTTAGVDYTAFTNQLVTFAPGETSKTVTVQVRQDDLPEADEFFGVQLSNATNATIINNPLFGSGAGLGTITNDDVHTLRISEGVTAAEGTSAAGFTPYVFTVSLAGTPTTSTVQVLASTFDFSGTTAGVDYTAFTNQLVTFAPGETSKTVTVQVRQDDLPEADEFFGVQLSNATNATIINNPLFGSGAGLGTITNDDDAAPAQPVIRLSEGVTHAEGTSADGFTPYVFMVSLSDATTTSSVTVDVTTIDGSATTAGADYTAIPTTTLTFAPGETSQTVTVQVRQDDLPEADEFFQVQLSNATNATIGGVFSSQGLGTITNDDVHTLRISEGVTAAEGTSAAGFTPYVFTVSLADATTTSSVTVDVTTIDGSATAAGEDYQALPLTTLTFAPGVTEQTVTVQVRQDDQVESDEYFQVLLSNATNATIINNPLFGSGAGLGTITNDDVHTLRISEGVTAAEGTSAAGFTPYVFTVSLAGTPTTSTVQVLASTFDFSGTTAGVDYTAFTNQLVTFAPGETSKTVTVQVRQDDLPEADEFFGVQLSNATNATIINNPLFGSGAGLGTITNDDVHTLRISEGVTAAEGTSAAGFTPYVFTVSLAGTPTTSTVQVLASTFDFSGTTAGVDYTAFTNQLVTFAPGETSKTVTVQVRQDDLPEADEFFGVQLSNATNATIINNPLFGSGAGLGTITNDDVHTLRISEGVAQAEGTSEAEFTAFDFLVTLSGTPTTSTVTALASTGDFSGTTAGVDYQAFTNQLVTFAPGEISQTVTVQVRQDILQESDEQFFVNLTQGNNLATIANGFGVGTITNDDAAPPVILDLDGDGLEFLAMGDASNQTLFDFNGDGAIETAAWVEQDDGFLVYDANGDRRVNDGSEIAFANMTAETDTDLEALKAVFDSNRDGLLTAADEQFSSFGVWQDVNGNGATEAGEFRTLDEVGIVSLGLTSDGVSYSAANGQVAVHGEASFTYQDGSRGLLGDVSLAIGGPVVSNLDSLSDGAGIDSFDFVLSRQANGLRNALQGSSDQVTGQNWYGGASPQVETIQTGNGKTLLSSQVNQLIEAMAGFSSDNGMTCDQGVTAKPEEVPAVIAASWQ